MIESQKELFEYLEADRKALGRHLKKPAFTDLIWKYEICLRKVEFFNNCRKRTPIGNLFYKYYSLKFFVLSVLCGYSIPINVFGKGLSIGHRGTIIVNSHSKIGDNCRIHACVNIGTVPGVSDAAPILGNNIYIAPGVKIYGNIHIASGIVIGANSVVNKSFDEEEICIAGVPAKKISNCGRNEMENRNSSNEPKSDNRK